jgi:hypothetical protein
MEFVARQSRGARREREMELHVAFERIRSEPLPRPISGYAAGSEIADSAGPAVPLRTADSGAEGLPDVVDL